MWPIFQHTLLMSCHINDSWGVVGEVFLGFLGFSGFLTNWNSSEVSAEEAFTGGVFVVSFSSFFFKCVPKHPPLPFLQHLGTHCLLSIPEPPGFEWIQKIKTHKVLGMVDKVNAEVLPVAEQLF